MTTYATILNKILVTWLKQYIKRLIHHDQVEFIPVMQGIFNLHKTIGVIQHISKLKNKNLMNLSIDAERAFDKFNVYEKNVPESKKRGNISQHNKDHIWQTHSYYYTQCWKAESIPQRSRTRQVCPLLPHLLNIDLEVLAIAEKKKK